MESAPQILYVGRDGIGEELRGIIECAWIRPGVFEPLDSWETLIEHLNGDSIARQLVLVDLFALCGTRLDIANYQAFLQQYASSTAKQENQTLLLIVQCLSDSPLERVVGWGTLVDAYCTLPLKQESDLSLFRRIESELTAERTADTR